MAAIHIRRSWNWTNSGPLLRKRRTKLGSGSLCAAKLVEWLPMPLGIAAKHLSPFVGGHTTCLPYRSLLHRFLGVYQAVILEEQHTAVGKETGETAHVGRWNNTLRQRLPRFVRKTLSFSKSPVMHEACLNLFLHRYNLERASILF